MKSLIFICSLILANFADAASYGCKSLNFPEKITIENKYDTYVFEEASADSKFGADFAAVKAVFKNEDDYNDVGLTQKARLYKYVAYHKPSGNPMHLGFLMNQLEIAKGFLKTVNKKPLDPNALSYKLPLIRPLAESLARVQVENLSTAAGALQEFFTNIKTENENMYNKTNANAFHGSKVAFDQRNSQYSWSTVYLNVATMSGAPLKDTYTAYAIVDCHDIGGVE